jgi:CrcB protein
MNNNMNLILIAIGGALGSIARYLSSEMMIKIAAKSQFFPASFPLGTFFVNIFGSALAGVCYFFVIKNFSNFDLRLKNFLFAGFLGGFTTFSAFSLDFFRLIEAAQIQQALIYALSSVLLSILAVFFGFYFCKLIFI